MGNNGIVTERAQHNIDKEKFDENHEKIFGKKDRVTCPHCGLSSRQKIGEDFMCPHCEKDCDWTDGEYK